MWQKSLYLIRRALPGLRSATGKHPGYPRESSRSKVDDCKIAWYLFSRWTVAYSVCALFEGYVVAADQVSFFESREDSEGRWDLEGARSPCPEFSAGCSVSPNW